MSTPNQPQDPYSQPGGDGSGQQPGGAPGGIPQYGQYSSSDPAAGYGQPQAYGQPAAYQQDTYGGNFPKNSLAVWSLVLGIVGLAVCGLFTAIPGIVLGSQAKKANARGEANNRSLATAGFIVSWIAVGLYVVGIVLFIIAVVAAGGFTAFFDEYSASRGY